MRVFDRLRQASARNVATLTSYALLAPEAPPVEAEAEVLPTTAHWAGPIGMEDELTGDARLIEGGALLWEIEPGNYPPLRWVEMDVGAHDGAEVAGSILAITRKSGGVIWGEGDLDMGSDAGRAAYVAIRDERQNGVSMDLDSVSFEIRVAGELYDEITALFEEPEEGEEPPEPSEPERDAEGRVVVAKINMDDEIQVTTSARIRAATVVQVPAFANARIALVDGPEDEDETPPGSDELSLVAGATPLYPPDDWFEPRDFRQPTALTVTKDGRVFGHLAIWGSCHVSHTAGGKCVTPPNSPSDYAWFHTGALETKSGAVLAVGHLTFNTGHAADDLSPAATLAHYDNTGTVAADVRAYEDVWGIQVVGGLRTTLTPEQIREFRSAPLSGDWRRVGSGLELVAALAVNVPGFGVPRPSGRIERGELVSLTASGIIVQVDDHTAEGLSANDLAYLRSFIDREKRHELATLVARRNRVKVEAFARRRRGR
jgi:hypothetical protein